MDYFSATSVVLFNLYFVVIRVLEDFILLKKEKNYGKNFMSFLSWTLLSLSFWKDFLLFSLTTKRGRDKMTGNGFVPSSSTLSSSFNDDKKRQQSVATKEEGDQEEVNGDSIVCRKRCPTGNDLSILNGRNGYKGTSNIVNKKGNDLHNNNITSHQSFRSSSSSLPWSTHLTLLTPFVAFFLYHIHYLSFTYFDYGYNMKVNIGAGRSWMSMGILLFQLVRSVFLDYFPVYL